MPGFQTTLAAWPFIRDSDVDEFNLVIEAANKLGVIALLLLGGIGLHRRWIVLGWTYEQCSSRVSALDQLLSANAARVESKLERLEESERSRNSRERP